MKKNNPTVLDTALEQKRKATERTFLKEWTPDQFKGMEKVISRHFSGKEMKTRHGNYPALFLSFAAVGDRIGLAYTSTSKYAAYWVCNTEVHNWKFPGYHYIGFALGTNRKGYAVLWDKDENEIIIPI